MLVNGSKSKRVFSLFGGGRGRLKLIGRNGGNSTGI